MDLLITLIIIFFVIAGAVAIIKKYLKKSNKQDKIDFKPHMDIDFENIKEKDLDTLKLEELRKIYIQLIDVESKIEKTNTHLKDIAGTLNLVAFFIIAPILIGIILKVIGVNILVDIL